MNNTPDAADTARLQLLALSGRLSRLAKRAKTLGQAPVTMEAMDDLHAGLVDALHRAEGIAIDAGVR